MWGAWSTRGSARGRAVSVASATAARAARRKTAAPSRRRQLPALQFGRERFKFSLHREQRRLPTLDIDPYVTSCNWQRSGALMTGEINFQRPLTGLQASEIAQEDRVRCHVDLGDGKWHRLWQMTVDTPSHQITDGLIAVALKGELKALERTRAAFKFRRKTARQITLEVARRFHVKVGRLPTAHHRIDRLVRKHATPLEVLEQAWKEEREATGRRFDVDLTRAMIDVAELREPAHMLMLGEAIMDATVTQSLDHMTSAVVVTSTRKVGGKRRKVRTRVVDQARVKRHGYIVRHVSKAGLGSEAAARRYGRQQLARTLRRREDLTFTHPGLPMVSRGDAVHLTLPQANIRQLAWLKAARHHVSAGSYTMECTVGFDDPWVDVRAERAKAKRRQAARRRQRSNAERSSAPPRPARASRRSGR